MGRPLSPQARAVLCCSTIFAAGLMIGRALEAHDRGVGLEDASDYRELRGPPTKAELGQAGWTLLHTMAANYADRPTPRERRAAESFLQALGDLYPCKLCAGHLRRFMRKTPVASQSHSREALSLYLCDAHNEVNRRNGKEDFFCDIGVLDHRWKDCGCGNQTGPDDFKPAGEARGDNEPAPGYEPY